MNWRLHMNFERILQIIQNKVYAYYSYPKENLIYSYEIIARFFARSVYDNINNSAFAKNILSYINQKVKADAIEYESILKRTRYVENKLRKGIQNNRLDLADAGVIIPAIPEIKKHIGRPYDLANLDLMLTEGYGYRFDLFHYMMNGSISDSHKVSDEKFAEAYHEYNQKYIDAKQIVPKKTDDKLLYILKWLDLFRIETAFHFSLISDISEYILDNLDHFKTRYGVALRQKGDGSSKNSMPYYEFSILWGTIKNKNYSGEAFQILRHSDQIKRFFEAYEGDDFEKFCSYKIKDRMIESEIINFLLENESEVFKPFFDGKESAIDYMYDFCKNCYPIIENHKDISFYSKNAEDDSTLNKPKIKIARQIIDGFLEPQRISEYYKNHAAK